MKSYSNFMILITLTSVALGCQAIKAAESKILPEVENVREAEIKTAFFGLDKRLTHKAMRISLKAYHKDGLPLVFSQEVNPITAEYFTITDNYTYVDTGRGCDCPKSETQMVVKEVWSEGVRAINGKELGQNELDDFKVTMVNGADTIIVSPYQLAYLKDNDNNIDLCLKEKGNPIFVEAKENVAMDPNDHANPKAQAKIVSRW